MSNKHLEINGKTYVVAKLKTVSTHDETVDKSLLVQHENPIEHSHLIVRKFENKFLILVGTIPNTEKQEIPVKVVTSVALKKAEHIEEVPEVSAPEAFRNTPRIQETKSQRPRHFGSPRDFNTYGDHRNR